MRSDLRRHVYGLAAVALALALVIGACDSTTAPETNDDAMVIVNGAGARLTLLLTDDPAELSQAWVEITGIYLQAGEHDQLGEMNGPHGPFFGMPSTAPGDGEGNTNQEQNQEQHQEQHREQNCDGDCEQNRVWLLEESEVWVDLLTLADTWTTLVAGAEIPEGVYSQLRFIVQGAVIVTAVDEEVFATSLADLASLNEYLAGAGMDEIPEADGELKCPSCDRTGFKVRFPGGGLVLESGDNILLIDFDV
ncbi:MAG TPA: DUF4382 domain-containing protein, partial [Gemmatimonadota bacterium]|nr:DUF4382 domain-containing protein [Gemmatimonadota bacterium]